MVMSLQKNFTNKYKKKFLIFSYTCTLIEQSRSRNSNRTVTVSEKQCIKLINKEI